MIFYNYTITEKIICTHEKYMNFVKTFSKVLLSA